MKLQAVFLDVGQTLIYPCPDGEAFAAIAASIGLELSPETVREHLPQMYATYEDNYLQGAAFWEDAVAARAVWLEAYTLLYRLVGLPEQATELARRAYEFYFNPGAWLVYPDARPALVELKRRGLRLGLISNWDNSLVPIIQGLGLSGYFETIIASADVGEHKPEPAIFTLALRRLNLPPTAALHVGDRIDADVQGAQAAGLSAVLLDRDNRYPDFTAAPRLQSLSELPALLDNWS
ncbi:MAG: HAD-IA family hydrolase [Actinomycetia bacterium]|nr:HAD-IA family hydrolase [Actinomycetes bacterium]